MTLWYTEARPRAEFLVGMCRYYGFSFLWALREVEFIESIDDVLEALLEYIFNYFSQ